MLLPLFIQPIDIEIDAERNLAIEGIYIRTAIRTLESLEAAGVENK